ncbi:PilZ domain-containing protein [Erythrobacter alti]|uniref:PilZ domain-containing protein n=1 Tax=Erythrobacter alti TaxID=1896145 RepID=UPI0030F3B544
MQEARAYQAGALPKSDENRRENGRVKVDLNCEIRVGARAWRKTRIADLTPGGFQVTILDMPARGTSVYLRFAGIQLLHAEVCWSDRDVAGCKFETPLSPYVFDHIVATAA